MAHRLVTVEECGPEARLPSHQRFLDEDAPRGRRIHRREVDLPPAAQHTPVERHGLPRDDHPALCYPLRLAVGPPDEVGPCGLDPRGLDLGDHPRVQALRLDQAGGHDPARGTLLQRGPRRNDESCIACPEVGAPFVEHTDSAEETREDRLVQDTGGRWFGIGRQLLRRRDVGQLVVQVLPLPHAHERQEILLAPAPRRAAAARALLARGSPQVQDRDEVGALVRELRVLLVGGLRLVGRALARVLDAQECRDDQRLPQASSAAGFEQDPRQPRVHRQARHAPAEPCDLAVAIDGAQFLQQSVSVVQEPRVRRVEEWKILRNAQPQRSHLQDQAREIGAQDLGIGVLRSRLELFLGVKADADALAHPPAAALALVGAGAGYGLDGQPLELGPWTVAADAGEPAVHDEPHARDRQRRLGHVGREHHPATGMRRKDPVLLRGGQARVERQDVPVARRRTTEQIAALRDLLLTGQEHEGVALDTVAVTVQLVERGRHCLGQ